MELRLGLANEFNAAFRFRLLLFAHIAHCCVAFFALFVRRFCARVMRIYDICVYASSSRTLEPPPPTPSPPIYATHSVCLPRGKCNAAWRRPGLVRLCLGFALVTCCALAGFLLVHCPAARQPRTLLLMTFVLCKPRTFESNLSLADEVVTVFRDFAILDCDFDLI